jgi:hypothetical protein
MDAFEVFGPQKIQAALRGFAAQTITKSLLEGEKGMARIKFSMTPVLALEVANMKHGLRITKVYEMGGDAR